MIEDISGLDERLRLLLGGHAALLDTEALLALARLRETIRKLLNEVAAPW